MTIQQKLSSFTDQGISFAEATKEFRPWNKVVLEWDVEYCGYDRGENSGPEGYVDFHVIVHIVEALVMTRNPKTYKKVKAPGYKLVVTQNMAFKNVPWESFIVYEESFLENQLKKAYDIFKREILNIQGWIEIAESRARIIPKANDVFECHCCGWVTDTWNDDILCQGCGKRYWSERLWRGIN